MKNVIVAVLLVSASLLLLAVTTLESATNDVLKRLNIPEAMAKDNIWWSFRGAYLSCPKPQEMKAIARGERAAIVQQVGEYARAYTQSEEFKKAYLEYRESLKPAPPEPPKPLADQRKEAKEELQKSILETEKNMKTASADVKKILKDVLASMKQQQKSLDDPNNPMYSANMEQMMQQGFEMQKQEYQQRLAKWESDMPLSPKSLVMKWLEKFLAASKDVDYNARLVPGKRGIMLFENPAYEQKPDEWKRCYRAGRETVEAGRAFATQWLAELSSQK